MALAPLAATFDRLRSSHTPVMAPSTAAVIVSDWRSTAPVLTGPAVTLRDLRQADAPALLRLLTTEEVTRFISPPPTTVEGFERFITWANEQRAAGLYMCFAIVPLGRETAVGIIQFRQLEERFATAEWGFALGQAFWGTGLFVGAAELALAFAFDRLGVHRLEARAAIANGRGNGALRKLGAFREAFLRKSFSRGGDRLDQALWSILADDWRRAEAIRRRRSRRPFAIALRARSLNKRVRQVRGQAGAHTDLELLAGGVKARRPRACAVEAKRRALVEHDGGAHIACRWRPSMAGTVTADVTALRSRPSNRVSATT